MSLENYKAIMLLHALGDTIGFKNGEWEFNFFNHDLSYKTTLEIVFQFISLGGFSSIDLKDWNVSDDTLIHIATAKTLLQNKSDKNNYVYNFKKNLIKTLQEIREDEKDRDEDLNEKPTLEKIKKIKFRGVGFTTVSSVEAWNDDKDISYKTSGGNGVAMRTLCVGAYYKKEKDLDKLVKFCIETGRTTHPSPIGYLGGVTSAYFVHLALNNVDIKKWPFKLLELIESEMILSYISSESHDEIIGYRRFISLWKKYIELRFKDGKPIFTKSHTNLIFRTKFFYDFTINYDEFYNEKIKDDSFHLTIGGSGVTCMLMVYDALLDAGDSWEKLIYYAMLHVGDSDTVGAIAGGIYGAIYGFKNVPNFMLEHIEKKDELIKLAEKIFDLI
jgi:ADP-ribosylarginine hydrolase